MLSTASSNSRHSLREPARSRGLGRGGREERGRKRLEEGVADWEALMAAVEESDGEQEVVAIGVVTEVGCAAVSLLPSWRRPMPVVKPDRMFRRSEEHTSEL